MIKLLNRLSEELYELRKNYMNYKSLLTMKIIVLKL